MTIPTMMNCPHTDSGWCLECVQRLHTQNGIIQTPVAWAYVNDDGECEQIEWGMENYPVDDDSEGLIKLCKITEEQVPGVAEVGAPLLDTSTVARTATPASSVSVVDWKAAQCALVTYVEEYEMEGDDGFYIPTENDKFMLIDCINGILSDADFCNALAIPYTEGG